MPYNDDEKDEECKHQFKIYSNDHMHDNMLEIDWVCTRCKEEGTDKFPFGVVLTYDAIIHEVDK